MVKITPKVRTILLSLLLIGSYFTTYANIPPSFLIELENESAGKNKYYLTFSVQFSLFAKEKQFFEFSKQVSSKLKSPSVTHRLKSSLNEKIQNHVDQSTNFHYFISFEKIFNLDSCDNDNVAPTALTKNITVQLDTSGNTTITAADVDNGSNDACGIKSFSVSQSSFTCSNIGANTITLTVIDNNDNVSTETAIVTVKDNVAPTALTKNITAQLDASGNTTITAADVDNGSNDACGIKSFSGSQSSFTCSNIGANTVTLTVTDNNDNVSTETAIVTVKDNVAPTALTKNITVHLDASGNTTITAADVDNGSNDACGIKSFSVSQSSFTCSNIGANTVTLTVTDNNDNVSTETAIVTVEDVTPPNIPVLQDIIWGCEYIVIPPTTNDICDSNVTVTPNRSTTFTTSGTIFWTFTDDSGNSSQSLEQTITINQISVFIDKTDILCSGASTGEVEGIVTGGVAPFTYDWGSQGAGPKKTGLGPENYSVIVTDSNGCTATDNITIIEPESFVKINNVSINTGCNGVNNASITINAEGGTGTLNYYLDGNVLADNTAEALTQKKYLVEVIDENGCSATQNISITEPVALAITEVKTTETTSFGSATGTATAIVEGGTKPYTYAWFNENGELLGEQIGQTAKDLIAGKYTVSVTDANECPINPIPTPFTIYDALFVEISASSRCIGNGGTEELRTSFFNTENLRGGTGDYTIVWDFENPSSKIGPDANGEYIIEYNSPGQRTINLTITDEVPRIDSNGNDITYSTSLTIFVGECYGKCTANDLNVSDFYLGDPDGVPYDTTKCGDITGEGVWVDVFEPGQSRRYNFYTEYVIIVSHPNGTITEYIETSDCRLGEIDRNKPQKITDIDYNCGDIITLEKLFISAGTQSNKTECNSYTDSPKCIGLEEPQVVPSPLSASAKGSQVLCINNPNGQITARAAGSQGTIQFILTQTYPVTDPPKIFESPIQTSNKYTFNSLAVGEYSLTVTDNKGGNTNLRDSKSYNVQNIEVTPPSNPLNLTEISRVGLSCYNGNNAKITVNATGGKAPYIYTWENGQTTATGSNLTSGPTWVKVIDDNGCDKTLPIVIVAPTEVIANAGNDVTLSCGVNKVVLDAIFPTYINPVTGDEEFGAWSVINGNSEATFSDKNSPKCVFTIQTSGTYTLQWTVPCGGADEVKITFSNCSTLDFDGGDDHIDLGNNYNPTSTYTMEAWIRPLDLTGTKTILSKRDNNDLSKGGFDLIIENSYPKFRWNTSSSIASDYIIRADRWYHIAIVIGGNDTGLYVDGIKVSSTAPGSPDILDDRFLIGAVNTSTDLINPENFFKGWIEEVRIWDTALTQKQLQFLMNQRVQEGVSPVQGTIIPNQDAYGLPWTNLTGYYRLIATDVASGFTKDLAQNKINGRLINILSTQKNTAPLPYVTAKSGDWKTLSTWAQPNDWDIPNSKGINTNTNDSINWNIVKIRSNDDITHVSNNKELKLLGLLVEGSLTMDGTNPGPTLLSNNGEGSGLNISRYLLLNGNIDFNGESQLVQTEGSILDNSSSGYIERDQQGTARSYNYNYWSSPVVEQNTSNTAKKDTTYTVASVLMDGTNPESPKIINFGDGVTFADGAAANPRKISNRWIYKFKGNADEYSDYEHIGSTGILNVGEGYTMKGTSGNAEISDKQNYVFRGKPNNGDITLKVGENQNYMLGNPYSSAIDAKKFILDNLKDSGGTNTKNIFNGALYFWDHFGGKNDNHVLREYVGGYATYNLVGGVKAIATDDRINSNTGEVTSDDNKPGRYIPVGQGFFINTVLDEELPENYEAFGGNVVFKNSQRVFKTEATDSSQFLRPEYIAKKGKEEMSESKIRLNFRSPMGYHRQILVGTSEYATNGFDLGYDAALNDYSEEDFFWLINNYEYVIQGVKNFNPDQVLPIGVYISKAGETTIEINELENIPDNTTIYLKDLETKLYHDLRESEFKIELEPGAYYERFQIVFEKIGDESEEAEEEETEEESNPDGEEEGSVDPQDGEDLDTSLDIVYMTTNRELAIINPDNLAIQKVVIYNLLGQKIQEYENIENKKMMTLGVKEFPMAVYLVKMYSEKGEMSKNIILMK
ncbi:LamG-like jellyroll fold domain-containing protein [Gillisia sp. JM1]|uniref:LamG-like jellyroll fold domain-containing protein n=1 Tax=Gillisia sp. JM1 TaxID=1283286 RepID=UPI00047AC49A|nr:LamG-like jellyroll fold domain-containing protein [Gillisia sp. JM1]